METEDHAEFEEDSEELGDGGTISGATTGNLSGLPS